METVLADFPSFRDVHRYGGLEVPLLKRVQILAADVWGCYEGAGAGAFADIGRLTMFADYRVPQILRFLGALAYTDSAQARLAAGELLPSGDPLEVEIRACSITAVEVGGGGRGACFCSFRLPCLCFSFLPPAYP